MEVLTETKADSRAFDPERRAVWWDFGLSNWGYLSVSVKREKRGKKEVWGARLWNFEIFRYELFRFFFCKYYNVICFARARPALIKNLDLLFFSDQIIWVVYLFYSFYKDFIYDFFLSNIRSLELLCLISIITLH